MMLTRAIGLGTTLRKATMNPSLTVRNHQLALRNTLRRRTIQTESLPPSANESILNQQRLKRPTSPHLTIYQPQLTWVMSIANRAAGVGLSVLLYGFSMAYLIAPGTFDSTHVIGFVQGLPDGVKYLGKTILALPFTFHSFNGLRHLAWDTVKFVNVKACYVTGYAVLGATAISTAVLAYFY